MTSFCSLSFRPFGSVLSVPYLPLLSFFFFIFPSSSSFLSLLSFRRFSLFYRFFAFPSLRCSVPVFTFSSLLSLLRIPLSTPRPLIHASRSVPSHSLPVHYFRSFTFLLSPSCSLRPVLYFLLFTVCSLFFVRNILSFTPLSLLTFFFF